MSIDEASQALGAGIDTATPLPDAPGCVYEVHGTTTVIGVEFTDQANWVRAHTGSYLKIALGDEAIFFEDSGGLVFDVRAGQTYFNLIVQLERGSPRSAMEVGKSAVTFVLTRLP